MMGKGPGMYMGIIMPLSSTKVATVGAWMEAAAIWASRVDFGGGMLVVLLFPLICFFFGVLGLSMISKWLAIKTSSSV